MLFGAHCSGGIGRALERAVEIGADAVQLFAQSPRAWRFPGHDPATLAAFRTRREEAGIGAVSVWFTESKTQHERVTFAPIDLFDYRLFSARVLELYEKALAASR